MLLLLLTGSQALAQDFEKYKGQKQFEQVTR